jgi:hypothetical protein
MMSAEYSPINVFYEIYVLADKPNESSKDKYLPPDLIN